MHLTRSKLRFLPWSDRIWRLLWRSSDSRCPRSPDSGSAGSEHRALVCWSPRSPHEPELDPPAQTPWCSSSVRSPRPRPQWTPRAARSRSSTPDPRCWLSRWRWSRRRIRCRLTSPRRPGCPWCAWLAWGWRWRWSLSRSGWSRAGPWRRARALRGSGSGSGSCTRGCLDRVPSLNSLRDASCGHERARTGQTRCHRPAFLRIPRENECERVWIYTTHIARVYVSICRRLKLALACICMRKLRIICTSNTCVSYACQS